MCNQCWNEHYATKGAVPLDKFYGDLYLDTLKKCRYLEKEDQILKKEVDLACEKIIKMKDADNIFNATQIVNLINILEKDLYLEAKENINASR